MTVEELLGQMIQADFEAVTNLEHRTSPEEAVTFKLGSLLVSGSAAPTAEGNIAKMPPVLEFEKQMDTLRAGTAANWNKLTSRFSKLGIPVTTKDGHKYKIGFLLGTDAVHGDQHTVGSVLFPHNIGMSCSHNPTNFYNSGKWTKEALKKSGFNYAFAPTVAVSHNPQWGRYYETMGQEDEWVTQYGEAYVAGLQDVSQETKKIRGVLASAKHFLADGATTYGCNMGNSNVYNFK